MKQTNYQTIIHAYITRLLFCCIIVSLMFILITAIDHWCSCWSLFIDHWWSCIIADYIHCVSKKRGVELLQQLHQMLTDFENSFTVGNSDKLSAK